MRNLIIGLFAGVALAGLPMGMVIKHRTAEVAAWKDLTAQVVSKSTAAMRMCANKLQSWEQPQ